MYSFLLADLGLPLVGIPTLNFWNLMDKIIRGKLQKEELFVFPKVEDTHSLQLPYWVDLSMKGCPKQCFLLVAFSLVSCVDVLQ